MFDCERGQMRVGGQVNAGAERYEQVTEESGVLWRRVDHYDGRICQPAIDDIEGDLKLEGFSECAGSGGDPQKCEKD